MSFSFASFILITILGGLLLCGILLAIRKGLLSEGYSVLWTGSVGLIFLSAILAPQIDTSAKDFGINLALGLLAFSILSVLIAFLAVITSQISKLRRDVRRLSQELAIRLGDEEPARHD